MRKITRRALLLSSPLAVGAFAAAPELILRRPRTSRAAETLNLFSTVPAKKLDVEPIKLVRCMQAYVDEYLDPVWNCKARIEWSRGPVPGAMNCAIVSDADFNAPGAIAYHSFDTNIDQLPYTMVNCDLALQNGGVSLALSHEVAEMLVNPGINLWESPEPFRGDGTDTDTRLFAMEIADPVERNWFKVHGLYVSDFVYPAYFEPWRDGPVDYLGAITHAKQIAEGGYQIVRDGDQIQDIVGAHTTDERCYRHKLLTAALTKRAQKAGAEV